MRLRHLLVGVVLLGMFSAGLAVRAYAAAPSLPIPIPEVGVPPFDPQHPQIPPLPYIPIPPQLYGLTGLISPVEPVVCNVSYLGPLAGIVALTAVFNQLPQQPPIPPSFLAPLFGPVTTACVLAAFPTITSCGPDAQITAQLHTIGNSLPNAGDAAGLGTIDPFATVPAPFASVVVELFSIQHAIETYALSGKPSPVNFGDAVSDQLGCS